MDIFSKSIINVEESKKNPLLQKAKSVILIQNNVPIKIRKLIGNLDDIYRELLIPEEEILNDEEIINKEDKKYYNKYYDTLRFIFYKEIKKVNDINYDIKIIEYLLKEKEIIKQSNDIFQILLQKYLKKNDFRKARKGILTKEDDLLKVIQNNLLDNQKKNYFSLSETLLYFFEKNSFIYLKYILYDKGELLEKEPKDIFKESIEFLKEILNSQKYDRNNKYIYRLFCLGYIRAYCYTFVKMFDSDNPKFDEPDKIIDAINKEDHAIYKMIRLYVYKIIFNENKNKNRIDSFINQKNKDIDVFLNPINKDKYHLEKYENFKDLIKLNEDDEEINYKFETLDKDNYKSIYKVLEENKRKCFKHKIKKQEIGDYLHIDNFYIASSNLLLIYLKKKRF